MSDIPCNLGIAGAQVTITGRDKRTGKRRFISIPRINRYFAFSALAIS